MDACVMYVPRLFRFLSKYLDCKNVLRCDLGVIPLPGLLCQPVCQVHWLSISLQSNTLVIRKLPSPSAVSHIISLCHFVQSRLNSAHAALAPWEGRNALDAVISAYNNVSLLRQQLKPTYRVHAAISGQDWTANIIPDNSKMQ